MSKARVLVGAIVDMVESHLSDHPHGEALLELARKAQEAVYDELAATEFDAEPTSSARRLQTVG